MPPVTPLRLHFPDEQLNDAGEILIIGLKDEIGDMLALNPETVDQNPLHDSGFRRVVNCVLENLQQNRF